LTPSFATVPLQCHLDTGHARSEVEIGDNRLGAARSGDKVDEINRGGNLDNQISSLFQQHALAGSDKRMVLDQDDARQKVGHNVPHFRGRARTDYFRYFCH
jgi:hypothetical protein